MTEGFFTIVEVILVTERKLECVDSDSEDHLLLSAQPHVCMAALFSWKRKVALLEKKKNQCSVVSVSVKYGLNSWNGYTQHNRVRPKTRLCVLIVLNCLGSCLANY